MLREQLQEVQGALEDCLRAMINNLSLYFGSPIPYHDDGDNFFSIFFTSTFVVFITKKKRPSSSWSLVEHLNRV